ncbi:MAG: poly-beta-1,6-N-acetyl-D-glucosamine biosynthesis protein PgaD [Thermoanaerobaculia bacterium]
MQSGEAPIAEVSTLDALRARQWSRRRPLPTGILSALTVLFWGVWLYLVLPLVSLLLWVVGVRFFIREIAGGGYEGLRASLVAYSSVLLGLVGLLALWIAWNVTRYGGSKDRRTVKRGEVGDAEVREAFRLDESLLSALRGQRFVRVDLNGGGLVVMPAAPPRMAAPALAVEPPPANPTIPESGPPQRGPESTRSG